MSTSQSSPSAPQVLYVIQTFNDSANMDYLGKLEKIRSAVSSSVSSTVFSTISTVKDVLPGNPVTRDFEVGEHIASGGPGKIRLQFYRIIWVEMSSNFFNKVLKIYFSGLIWKIYSGVKKSTRQSAAVFVLEKRALDAQYPDKTDREAILDQCRKAVAQLTRLKHPQVLTVQVRTKSLSMQTSSKLMYSHERCFIM